MSVLNWWITDTGRSQYWHNVISLYIVLFVCRAGCDVRSHK